MTTVPVHVASSAGALQTTVAPTAALHAERYPLIPNIPSRIINAVAARDSVVIRPWGGNIYVGPESVSTGSGFIVPDGTALTLTVSSSIYAVTDTTGVEVHILSEHRDGQGQQ